MNDKGAATNSSAKSSDAQKPPKRQNSAQDDAKQAKPIKKKPSCLGFSKKHSISFQIRHGGDIEILTVSGHDEPCVRDLLLLIEKNLKIPFADQRLLYRGIKLHLYPDYKMADLELFPMSVIKVTGTRSDVKASIL